MLSKESESSFKILESILKRIEDEFNEVIASDNLYICMPEEILEEYLKYPNVIWTREGDRLTSFGYPLVPIPKLVGDKIFFIVSPEENEPDSSELSELCFNDFTDKDLYRDFHIAVFDSFRDKISFYTETKKTGTDRLEISVSFVRVERPTPNGIYLTYEKYQNIISQVELRANEGMRVTEPQGKSGYKVKSFGINPRDYTDVRKWGLDVFTFEMERELLATGNVGSVGDVKFLMDRTYQEGTFTLTLEKENSDPVVYHYQKLTGFIIHQR